MDSLSPFLPADRLNALAHNRNIPDRAVGTVLFADVSGFTPLTAAFARGLGPQRGAEEMTVHLDRVCGALIAEVHRYRGSVISFSGDAITCWFDENYEGGIMNYEENAFHNSSFILHHSRLLSLVIQMRKRILTRENLLALALCLLIILLLIVTTDSAPQWIYQGF